MAPIAVSVIILVIAFIFLGLFGPRYDSREPIVLPQKIPFLGHLLGLLRYGLNYYTTIR